MLMTSGLYWAITAATVVAACAGSLLWFYGECQAPKNFILAGAAFPILLKKGIAALNTSATTHLGNRRENKISLWEYLDLT